MGIDIDFMSFLVGRMSFYKCLRLSLVLVFLLAGGLAGAQQKICCGAGRTFAEKSRPGDFMFGTAEKISPGKLNGASGIQFNVVFDDVASGTKFGFDDESVVGLKTLGQVRRETLFAVLDYLNSVLEESGVCDIEVLLSRNGTMGVLATGEMQFTLGSGPEFNPGNAFLHITNGSVDPSSNSIPDLTLRVDFGFEFNSELDAPTIAEFDLFSVLLHEITHGLGFLSLTSSSGNSTKGTGKFTHYDDLLFTNTGSKLWDSTTAVYLPPETYPLTGSFGQGVVFSGLKATAEFGSRPAVYTPTGFTAGRSISHWAAQSPGPLQPVMDPFFQSGIFKRKFQKFELFALADLGYKLRDAPAGAIVINELRYDDAGLDDLEFIELKNISQRSIDLSLLALLKFSKGIEVTSATLTGSVLAPGEYYLIGTALGSEGLSGVGIVVDETLPAGWGELWNGPGEGVALINRADDSVVDDVSYEGILHGPGATDSGNAGEVAANDILSLSRFSDGWDTDNNTQDFRMLPATPGLSNGSYLESKTWMNYR